MSWIDDKSYAELARVREAREAGVYPYFRPFESGGLRTSVGGHGFVNFSSNDYLGLTSHPRVKEAAHAAVDRYACGLSSSRVQATTVAHVELEARLAKFFGFERALITTTGYQAMVATVMTLADRDTTLALDNLSHACILDGTFLAAGTPGRAPELRFFNHNSARSLERVLKSRERKNALVLVEGIYSLDGDKGQLREIVEVCERHGAALVVDDAHGSGTLGVHGRGVLEDLGLEGRAPVVVSTFSKVFGGIGGIILGATDVVEFIQHTARSFVFSATLPVPIVAAAATVLSMLEEDGPALVAELHDKARYMRENLTARGFDLGASDTHIMPVMVKDERKALVLHHLLYERGLHMVPITYPGVKAGEERLRVNITRGHTREELDHALEVLTELGTMAEIRFRA
ncbi:MAG: aminotransferase class I/II-fold pyridoxal phosphate-dependent enzyme [Deltaproteobacteria bacterium]|nr:aminotransferase class I/II-fold pyridoxal phosphate-dependent enzyme [Deltaproteobacteria bacterium]